jgi:hypothetical protein
MVVLIDYSRDQRIGTYQVHGQGMGRKANEQIDEKQLDKIGQLEKKVEQKTKGRNGNT